MNNDTDTMNDAQILEFLTDFAAELARYSGNLDAWATSFEDMDRWLAQGMRNRGKALALATFTRDAADLERIAIAFHWACMGDAWATKEIAGRYLSACRRLALYTAIERHPRARKFASLVSALRSGKFTAKQLAFAKTLAAEAA